MGSGFRTFASGEVLTSSNVQNYLMDQAVMVFAGTAERGSALPSPEVGMTAYSTATGMQVWDGSAWVNVGGAGIADFSDAATGTYSSGGTAYKYITYTASGTLTVTEDGLADLLVVGGGGGGSGRGAGGGGGHLLITDAYLPIGTLTVTVGAGGAGVASGQILGSDGSFSRVNSYYAVGGGAGAEGGAIDLPGRAGGSGGGGRLGGGAEVTGQGSAGGAGASGAGGGGGGASAVGANATTNNGGAGGAGTSTSLDNSATTRAGGGGGAGTSSGGAGGAGGGGAGSTTTATAGTVNTGGGGGGGNTTGAAGGSGIVIVRVKV